MTNPTNHKSLNSYHRMPR